MNFSIYLNYDSNILNPMSSTVRTRKKPEVSTENLKNRIMAVARRQFALKGYQGASLKEIAKESKVAGSLVNYHFKDKEGLFSACMETFAQQRVEAIQRLLAPPSSKEEIRVRLSMFVEEMIHGMLENADSFEILDRELHSNNPLILKIFEQTLLKAFRSVIEFFMAAQKGGLLKEGVEPLVVASALMTVCSDTVRKEILAKRFFNLSFHNHDWRKKFTENIVYLFMNGVIK